MILKNRKEVAGVPAMHSVSKQIMALLLSFCLRCIGLLVAD